MPTIFTARSWWLKLGWLPLALIPVQPAANAAKGPSHGPAAGDTVIQVPRTEVHEIPASLRSSDLDSDKKKRLFVRMLLPLLLLENEKTRHERSTMLGLFRRIDQGEKLAPAAQKWLRELASDYRVEGDPVQDAQARTLLRRRVDVIPVDLALAQAALESGWGRSRHARKNRDLFGMTGLTRKSRGPKFSSLRNSVHTYLRTLNSHPAYQRLRVIRANLRKKDKPLQGLPLTEGLTRYSELGRRYVKMVRTMIRHNDFDRYTEAKLVQPAGQEYALLFVPEPG